MKFFLLWCVALNELHLSVSVIVRFLNKEPLFVELNKTLVLEADFKLQQGETVLLQTWERKNGEGEIRVAESGIANNPRISVEKNGALLRIRRFEESDYGKYRLTVTINTGEQVSDARNVKKITNPPKASLYMLCTIPSVGARWDAPSFSWQVDGVTITNETGEISADGSTLRLTKLGRNYTCITDSSQGTSEVQVFINEPIQDQDKVCSSCSLCIVFAVLELFIIFALLGIYCYKKKFRAPVVRLQTADTRNQPL